MWEKGKHMRYHTIAEAFRKERHKAEFSQEKLAELLNTHRHRIIDIGNGRTLPDSKNIEGACRVFGIKARDLLCLEEENIVDEILEGLTDEKIDILIEKIMAGLARKR